MTATPRRQDNADTYNYFGDPIYITPANALPGTASGNTLYGHALTTKAAAAGPLTVRIAN